MTRFLTLRNVLSLALAVVVIAALWGLYSAIRAHPKAEAKLARNQAAAAASNGSDAVNAVASSAASEAAIDQTTRENADAIRKAEGANAPVAAPVRDAGLRALCKRRAYLGDPKCVQFAPAR